MGAIENESIGGGEARSERKPDVSWFDALSEVAEVAAMACDGSGKAVWSNKHCRRICRSESLVDFASDKTEASLMASYHAASETQSKGKWSGWQSIRGESRMLEVSFGPIEGTVPLLYLATARDKTDVGRLELRLENEREKSSKMMEAVNEAVLYVDDFGHVERASSGMLELLGKTNDQIRGLWIGKAVRLADRFEAIEAPMEEMLSMERVDSDRWLIESGTGELCPVELRWRRLDEKSFQGVLSLRDITDRVRDIERMQWEAHHDALTGLLNKRAFGLALDEVALRLSREPVSCAVLMMDLDGFKEVNDDHGHEVGDEILKMVADTLSGLADPFDYVARIGGDEFAMVMQGATQSQAQAKAKEIADSIESSAVKGKGGALASVGISIGCAELDHGDAKGRLAMRSADDQMYRRKALSHGQARDADRQDQSKA